MKSESKRNTDKLGEKSERDRPLNLPRVGIFQANEVRVGAVPWRSGTHPLEPDAEELAHRIAFHCFLCGVQLTSKRGAKSQDTGEDVFPKWMQRHFRLSDKLIRLEDGSWRSYSEVLVPCCARCNNEYLSRFEDRIVRAFRVGFERFAQLRKADIFLWCAKIYYGLVHLEVCPRNPTTKVPLKPTLPQETLEDLNFLLRLLQGFRKRVVIFGVEHAPFSLLLFPLRAGRDPLHYFKVKQVTIFPGIALQLGPVGIISVFDDFGETEEFYGQKFLPALGGKALHPDQFWELAGRLLYRAYLVPLETSMSLVEGKDDMMLNLLPRPVKGAEPDPWEAAEWIARIADTKPGFYWSSTTKAPNRTLLLRPDGSFNELVFEDISGL
jgi:hypothetical protein